MKSLKDILVKEEANAVKRVSSVNQVLTPGEYNMKILGFIEEENYSYISVECQGRKYNFFYNLFNKEGQLDLNTLTWIKNLATCTVGPDTSLLDIVNSAVGATYNVKVYNYTSKTGKNAGKTQHAIDFNVAPTLQINDVTSEDILVSDELPY